MSALAPPGEGPANTAAINEPVARVIAFYEALAPADLDRLAEIYAADAYFRDPFNEVRGLPAVRNIFAGMFTNLADARFAIIATVAADREAFLTWDMTYRIRKWKPETVRSIHGATHLRFDAEGKVDYHRDYWDAAGELYAKLPLIGPVIRYLRHKLA